MNQTVMTFSISTRIFGHCKGEAGSLSSCDRQQAKEEQEA
jgi:hypothetical protein